MSNTSRDLAIRILMESTMLLQGRPAVEAYKKFYGNIEEIDKSILELLRKGYMAYNIDDGKLYNTPLGDLFLRDVEGIS